MSDMQLFNEGEAQNALMRNDAAAVARATQEIQASLVIAQRFPRDEVKAKSRILQACQRKGLAEVSEYEYTRGGTRITGPTIDLLRAVANRWGNLLYGWDEAERKDGYSRVRCWAWDTQSNSRAERTMQVKHWRDTSSGGYALSDERDIYEVIANQAARRVRACLEEVIDSDIVQDAIDQCRKTLRDGEKTPLRDRAVHMVTAFAEHGVTQAMIEKRLGNKLEAISENQLASLRRVFTSLRDGVGKREDYFKPEVATSAPDFGEKSDPDRTTSPAPEPEKPKAKGKAKAAKEPEKAPVASEASPFDATPPPKAQEQPEAKPEAAGPPVKPPGDAPALVGTSPEPESPIKRLRELCHESKVKEGRLLGFLGSIGLSDGSVGTLEELQLSNSELVAKVISMWPKIAERINSVKE